MKEEKFKLFWRGEFSQWYKADMYDPITGLTFNCCEQFMMYGKAKLFGDEEAMEDIMSTSNPRKQQAIGRQVKGFDQEIWDENARAIVTTGNYLKFTQNPDLLAKIMMYADHTFVEASPIDTIWGIGLSEDDDRALDREQWEGKNWLGECITAVKEKIIDDQCYWHTDRTLVIE